MPSFEHEHIVEEIAEIVVNEYAHQDTPAEISLLELLELRLSEGLYIP